MKKKKSAYEKSIEKRVKSFSNDEFLIFKRGIILAVANAIERRTKGEMKDSIGFPTALASRLHSVSDVAKFINYPRNVWEDIIVATLKFDNEIKKISIREDFYCEPETGVMMIEQLEHTGFNLPEIYSVK